MRQLFKKTKKIVKGAPLGVIISATLHGILLLIAAGWVIFTIIERREQKFVPQQIKRPEMQLKKLRVKVKESVKPRKTVERITAARRSADLPDLQLPALTGMGTGLEGGVGGFEMMADLSQMTLFGGGKSMGNDLEGTFYHFMRDRNGNAIPGMTPAYGANPLEFYKALEDFLENDWDPAVFDRYYRSPVKLYATHIMIPPRASELGPASFGIKENIQAALWVIHYKGKIAHEKGGTFRFLGMSDDLLMVRINGKFVLDANIPSHSRLMNIEWRSSSDEHQRYRLGPGGARVGDWFTLEPGVPVDMEVLVSEVPGGWFFAMLNVQEYGVDYPENEYDAPIFPVFRTMELPEHIVSEIKYGLIPGDADVENGPVFSVY